MPLLWEARDAYLVVTMRGSWVPADLLALLHEVFEPEHDRTFSGVLMDDRDSTFDPPTRDLREFVRSCKPFADRFGRRVAIAVDSDLKYGLARMASSAATAREDAAAVEVFRDADEAWRWLSSAGSEGDR